MTWKLQADGPGRWVVQLDGEEVGSFSMLDTIPSTGRALFPSVRAGHLAAALNDFDATVDISPHRLAGWTDPHEYHTHVEGIRDFTTTLPPAARAEIETAWHRHDWPYPLTRTQMAAWQDEVLDIAARHEPEAAA